MRDPTNTKQEFGAASQAQVVMAALLRGRRRHCPRCGKGRLFRGYLKVTDSCTHCALEFHHQRADDAPPYFTCFLVGHIVIGAMLFVEQTLHPQMWVHWTLWPASALVLCGLLLPQIKGMLIGLQWALGMHGFALTRE